MHDNKHIADFIRKNRGRYTAQQIADHFKVSRDRVYGLCSRQKVRELLAPDLRQENTMKRNLREEARLEHKLRGVSKDKKDSDRKYRMLQDQLREVEKARDAALEIKGYRPKVSVIKPSRGKQGEATAVALLSDVHCDEVVPKHKVNYLNEHNPDISKRRVAKFFELLVRFIRVEQHESSIKNLVLWLGGDFFTSDMHGAPTAFPPITACMFATDMLASGLTFLQENEPNLAITIVGSVGNHSRKDTARPVNQALEQENSLEWMMYHSLRHMFPDMKWQLDNSYHSYVRVYNKTIRFCHGHLGFRYNKGQAGIHGPLFKAISETWNNQVHADLTCIGHYHMYTPAARARGYVVNGSTIGAAPYGIQFGYEDPCQAFFLIHNNYGVVGQRPLLIDA